MRLNMTRNNNIEDTINMLNWINNQANHPFLMFKFIVGYFKFSTIKQPMRQSIVDLVESAISSNKVVVFSKTSCGYCSKAKGLLNSLKVPYKSIELDTMPEGADIQAYLLEKTSQRTVPNIFIGQNHVGGSSDLFDAQSSGQLEVLLR